MFKKFEELRKLKNKMDECEKATKSLGDDYAVLENEEYNKAVMDYLRYGQEYYDDENLSLVELNNLVDLDSKFDAKRVVDYYEEDEALASIANSVFSDVHFGNAITEEEHAYRMQLAESYKDAIAFAKVIIQNNPNFEAMSEKQKINFVANILVTVKEKMDAKKDDIEDFSPKF